MITRDKTTKLFPSLVWDHGWKLSLQADRSGYACSPTEAFDNIDDYDTVEAVLYGPFVQNVDPLTLELPAEVASKFSVVTSDGPAIGRFISKSDLEAIKTAIQMASFTPNAGVPQGAIGWPGRSVFHGCSEDSAKDIEDNGILMDRSTRGYFGQAFYVAEDEELAREHYANFAGDNGPVIEFFIKEGAQILDLRNEKDAAFWQDSGLPKQIFDPNFAFMARRKGIDGVYDRSFGGIAIYNASVLDGCNILTLKPPSP